jgi:hypothetical protein
MSPVRDELLDLLLHQWWGACTCDLERFIRDICGSRARVCEQRLQDFEVSVLSSMDDTLVDAN